MRRFGRFFAVLLTAITFVVLPSVPANAQSNALGITPRKDYSLSPGESVDDTLTINNLNNGQPLALKLQVIDFKPTDETGTPSLIVKKDEAPTPWSIKSFVTIPQQVTIDAGKSVTVPISVKVPANQGAGSYYGAIQYSNSATDSQQVNVAASGATLVFVDVPGQAREQLQFVQFGAFVPDSKNASKGSFSGLFVSAKPKLLAYRLHNQGNIAEMPQGAIHVKNMFGKQVITIGNVNPAKQLALIDQIRRFESCMNPQTSKTKDPNTGQDIDTTTCQNPKLTPGRYTAELSIFYGSNGNETREITAATSFWYLPWWFIIAFLVVLALIAGLIFFLVRKIMNIRDVRGRRSKH